MCDGPECDRPGNVAGSGLCRTHRYQQLHGGILKPIEKRRPKRVLNNERDENGNKQCSDCLRWKPESEFNYNKRTPSGLEYDCKDCRNDARRLRMYGLTPERFKELLDFQLGRCAVCKAVPDNPRSMHVDHNHACCPGKKSSCGICIRGLLCGPCNTALGLLRDNKDHIESLMYYLELNWQDLAKVVWTETQRNET